MKLQPKEIEAVSLLDPFKRYQYFIKKVADSEVMYTLIDIDNEIAVSDIDNQSLIPFWSAPEFVEQSKLNGWENFEIKEIDLAYFENTLIDYIETENLLLNIFSIDHKTGFVVSLEEFIRDLDEELEKY